MASMAKETDVEIDALAAGGDGVGRVRGKVCFVPLSAPGDRLRIRVVQQKQHFIRGAIVRIIEPGPSRRETPCSLFGSCGGCQWLHVDEKTQLVAKCDILSRAIKRDDVPIAASPRTLGYRRVARLHYDPQSKALGFARAGERTIIDVESCPILAPALNKSLTRLKAALCKNLSFPAELRLALGENGLVVCLKSEHPLPKELYSRAEEMVEDNCAGVIATVDGHTSTIAGETDVCSKGGDGGTLIEPAASFGQANTEVNGLLVKTVANWVTNGAYKRVLELFAGAGNLTVAIAPHAKVIRTGEQDPDACRAARENVARRDYGGVAVLQGDALQIYRETGSKADLVVLDPPRIGHRELCRALAAGTQKAVLYISCNPATLARDLTEFNAAGFQMTRAKGFDMFPQTSHVESAVLLER